MAIEIPKEWKPAATGEEELDYFLYDLVASGTTASAKLTFFNQNEASNGIAVTNMPMNGQLPSTQRFLVKAIEVLIDVNAAAGDAADVLDAAVIDLKINNERKISLPAIRCSVPVSSTITQTATLGNAISFAPFELDKGLVIMGGIPFAVEMTVGKTAASATSDITMMLRGRLVRPD